MPPATRQATRRAAARAEEIKSEVEEPARAAPSVNVKIEDIQAEDPNDDDAQSRDMTPEFKEEYVKDEAADDDDDAQSRDMTPEFKEEDVHDEGLDDDGSQSRSMSPDLKEEDVDDEGVDEDNAQSRASSVNIKSEDIQAEESDDDDAQSRAVTPELKEESHHFVKDEIKEEIKEEPGVPRVKRRAPAIPDREANNKRRREDLAGNSLWNLQIIAAPARRDPNGHSRSYHHPLLLNNLGARQDLLSWFDSVTSHRAMPWRKPWINPALYPHGSAHLRQMLEKRAYEVWISEVMLQQTRVATVIDYWNRWMDRWPTIQHLAAADRQEVLDAWRGLGYYNRATRIHQAAKTVCKSFGGLIPSDVEVLQNKMAGVGRYTAGAIAAIVYGKPAALVDGNVLRVMSRQMGLFGEIRSTYSDAWHCTWKAAEELAEQVVRDEIRGIELVDADEEGDGLGEEDGHVKKEEPNNRRVFMMHKGLPLSDKPGKLGQALMELGSTICTPKPDCTACPITSTCRAYSEGFALALHSEDISGPGTEATDYRAPALRPRRQVLQDIEDLCTWCDEGQSQEAGICTDGNTNVKYREVNNGHPYRIKSILTLDHERTIVHSARAFAMINHHTAKYPPKPARKTLKQQESQVFALRRVSDGRYLIQRRTPKGLLPNMWELPSTTFDATPFTGRPRHPARKPLQPNSEGTTENVERELLDEIIIKSELLISPRPEPVYDKYGDEIPNEITRYWDEAGGPPLITHVGELGIIPWTFSHIKMFMYVQFFELDDTHPETRRHHHWAMYGKTQRWLTPAQVDEMTMGAGMRRCWEMVKRTEEELLGAAE
ncbi:hypothetical protein QBC37DRAFT_425240 [Rhypophila decipiens]|uniref:Adenine DNA glycosylase n=1 Tax=Rhypophila decipiens TaxID=261697 RepID=A0AAN6Y441_9PEZI|nr:hypothetical protein QBC37DRAFT_425240 [Rhypophila decipiens]